MQALSPFPFQMNRLTRGIPEGEASDMTMDEGVQPGVLASS